MPLPAASFNLYRIKRNYFVNILDLAGKANDILFLFDTGSSVSLIGLNTICGNDLGKCNILKGILENEIRKNNIVEFSEVLRTATDETVNAYPCKCDGISVSYTSPITFYFHIYLGSVSIPLLGMDYIDDSSFSHNIAGGIEIKSIASDVGKRFYPERVIDFNAVIDKYNKQIYN